MSTTPKRREEYTIGWICALSKEQTAATSMLDETHPSLDSKPHGDTNAYTLGSIGCHNVAITCLPLGYYGTNQAANVANNMKRTFLSIRSFFLVGIGAGIPGKVELGDVVIGTEWAQWDFGKTNQHGIFEHTGKVCYPPQELLSVIQSLQSKHDTQGRKTMIPTYLGDLKANHPNLEAKYTSIGDPKKAKVHYGLIASGNQVVKNEKLRDSIAKRLSDKVLCIEMEAAGLVGIPAIVIRGICDYADSNKNDEWQEYAAAVAAACTKELLGLIEPATTIDVQVRQKEFDEAIHSLTKLKKSLDGEENWKILDWITPIDDSSRHNDTLNRREPGTGEWLLNSTEYQNWLNTAKEVLFCPGIPGAGKTILSSIVIEHLIDRYSYNPAVGVAYIYFNYKVNAHIKVDELLSNLLKQLARTQDSLSNYVKDLYDRCKGIRPSRAEIVQALGAVVASYSRVFIIVDALDEYERCSEFLGQLFEIHKNYALNIFATSRPIPEIRGIFERHEISLMELEIRASEADIIKYLEGQILHSGGNIVRRNKALIIYKISKLAQGMFLLAYLYFEAIKTSRSLKKLNEALESFTARGKSSAGAYDNTYQAIMESIQGYGDIVLTETAFQVLSWIICASRPLTKAELQYAIAVEHLDEASEIDIANLSDVDDLVSYCRGLVTIDEQSNIIRLIHYTVQEYFERTKMTWFPNSHSDIAKICVIYLSHDTFKSGPCSTYGEFQQRLQSNALYKYAARNWDYHIRESTNGVERPRELSTNSDIDWFTRRVEMIGLVINLLSEENTRLACVQAMFTAGRYGFRNRESIDRVTGLHVAAHCGLTVVTKVILAGDGVDLERADNESRTAVLFATTKGYEDIVQVLIESGANPEAKNNSGDAAILLAVGNGHESIVRMLIGIGVNLETRDKRGRTALMVAVGEGYENIAKLLIKSGARLEGKDEDGKTALTAAVEEGYKSIVEILIESGASVEAKGKNGKTALIAAAEGGYENIVEILIESGASVEAKGKNGRTALIAAAEGGYEGIVKILIESGASVEDKDEYDETALWKAADHNRWGVMRMLIDRRADLKVKNKFSQTLLSRVSQDEDSDYVRPRVEALINWEDEDNYRDMMILSAGKGYEDIIRLLMEKGVGSTAFDGKYGQDLLWNAVTGGHAGTVGLLVERGILIDLDQHDKNYEGTPLTFAVRERNEGVVRALLERADPDAPDDYGETPLQAAVGKKDERMVRILAEKGATPDAKLLYLAFKSGNKDIIKFLMESGVDLQTRDIKGRAALSVGVIDWDYDRDALELLLEEGSDLESRDNKERTPLLLAVKRCAEWPWYNEGRINFLIKKGANLEARDISGQTSLSIAAKKGKENLVRLLVAHGANLESSDNCLQTPLSIAAGKGHEGIVGFLVEEGANLETIDKDSKTPLQYAITNEHESVIRILTAKKIETVE
ncbi:hypothetical protein TWF106_000148 [Orbilia oligospora]|uniref:Uncharacterized protein n=1 Tax=Orbilia oligospora TaxID=2813651 RepID=A0A7C8UX06_ORBOL|nr:hypothetical protein TWF106_000086 [Orbilia oligospora]KAF3229760.1 hypothetical protein TWF106_000148 [Orbilia oligospora]